MHCQFVGRAEDSYRDFLSSHKGTVRWSYNAVPSSAICHKERYFTHSTIGYKDLRQRTMVSRCFPADSLNGVYRRSWGRRCPGSKMGRESRWKETGWFVRHCCRAMKDERRGRRQASHGLFTPKSNLIKRFIDWCSVSETDQCLKKFLITKIAENGPQDSISSINKQMKGKNQRPSQGLLCSTTRHRYYRLCILRFISLGLIIFCH
jgi:hypothetical protein